VFDDELLGHILKVTLAHLLEPLAYILFYKLIFFCLCTELWESILIRIACVEGKCAMLCGGRYLLGSSGRDKSEEWTRVRFEECREEREG
jgi:hypothetical protein